MINLPPPNSENLTKTIKDSLTTTTNTYTLTQRPEYTTTAQNVINTTAANYSIPDDTPPPKNFPLREDLPHAFNPLPTRASAQNPRASNPEVTKPTTPNSQPSAPQRAPEVAAKQPEKPEQAPRLLVNHEEFQNPQLESEESIGPEQAQQMSTASLEEKLPVATSNALPAAANPDKLGLVSQSAKGQSQTGQSETQTSSFSAAALKSTGQNDTSNKRNTSLELTQDESASSSNTQQQKPIDLEAAIPSNRMAIATPSYLQSQETRSSPTSDPITQNVVKTASVHEETQLTKADQSMNEFTNTTQERMSVLQGKNPYTFQQASEGMSNIVAGEYHSAPLNGKNESLELSNVQHTQEKNQNAAPAMNTGIQNQTTTRQSATQESTTVRNQTGTPGSTSLTQEGDRNPPLQLQVSQSGIGAQSSSSTILSTSLSGQAAQSNSPPSAPNSSNTKNPSASIGTISPTKTSSTTSRALPASPTGQKSANDVSSMKSGSEKANASSANSAKADPKNVTVPFSSKNEILKSPGATPSLAKPSPNECEEDPEDEELEEDDDEEEEEEEEDDDFTEY